MVEMPVSYTDVVLRATCGIDYDVTLRQPGDALSIVALHGGTLAPFTAELATELAGDDHNLYLFVAHAERPELRISPLRAREPRLDVLIDHSMAIVSIDACDDPQPVARIGGMNAALAAMLSESLAAVDVAVSPSEAPGIDLSKAYFFNRATEGGMELSFSTALLETLYEWQGCEERRQRLVRAVRDGLQQYLAKVRSDLARTMERFERDTARIPIAMRQTRGRRERNDD